MKKIIATLGVVLGLMFATAPAFADDHNPLPDGTCLDSHGQPTPCQPPVCLDSHGQVVTCPPPADTHPTATVSVDQHPTANPVHQHLRFLRLRHWLHRG